MATNRPEAVLDFKLSTSRPIAEVSTVTKIITDSTISTITTTTSSPTGGTPSNCPATAVIRTGTVDAGGDSSSSSGGVPPGSTTINRQPPVPVRPPRIREAAIGNLVQPRDEVRPPAPLAANGGPVGGVVGVPKSTCTKCTNISIMQLFYEMKQKFPTVSDDVVHETVLANCHNRDNCLTLLRQASATNQSLVPQSYPAKSLRGDATLAGRKGSMPITEESTGLNKQQCDNNNGVGVGNQSSNPSNPNTLPRRGGTRGIGLPGMTSPPVVASSGASVNGIFRRQSDTNHPESGGGVMMGSSSDMLSNGGSFISNNIQRLAISNQNNIAAGGGAIGSNASPVVGGKVERPSTLNLSASPNRPFRAAPPIPSITSSTSSLSSLSTATDLASASSPQLTASNESINVSVNVTLSPVIGHRTAAHVSRPPIPPSRHTTELTVQPEILPFVTTNAGATTGLPTRSFTTVNFTLRQPGQGGSGGDGGSGTGSGSGATGTTIGYPIDISTAGSTMTYSSSSYDAKQGYQSQLQITVGSGGGSISAIRTKAPTMVTTSMATGVATVGSNSQLGQTMATSNLLGTNQRLNADTEEVLINRQLQSKWKLSTELDKYRKRLDTMQRDVKALQMPLPASAPGQLQDEIERLQTVCDQMAAAVEKAGNFALGETNEAFYQRLDSQGGASTPVVVQPQRPPRPPAPQSTPTATSRPGGRVDTSSNAEDNEGGEGWICSQCTFQNHPMLNMCEQCGMVKRPPVLQHQQSHQAMPSSSGAAAAAAASTTGLNRPHQPAGIVQITSSQFIPAHVNHPPNPAAVASLTNHQHHQYLIGNYAGLPQPLPHSSPMVYNAGVGPYPAPMFTYPSQMQQPPMIVTPTTNVATTTTAFSPSYSVVSTPSPCTPVAAGLTPPATNTQQKSPKNKRGSKFNSKLSQSISNLFSSSSSSNNNNNNSH